MQFHLCGLYTVFLRITHNNFMIIHAFHLFVTQYRVAIESQNLIPGLSSTFLSHFSGLFQDFLKVSSLLSPLASHWVSGFTILSRQSTGKTS